ncbi:MAG TPA: sigma-70 family RNA polymerase sigma factor [Candidatus Lachnoclostridium stercoripullorum]|uniref:Sigma-70 family RNA polymerase sigma factor n=1 Tax=Candidatus Lachnoclostridium stercoripullorum TaxID=2838635 RepID=A0A9D1W2G1_9FIRM|nr:sigma-70 family RNA polymerase sigma factor [Candidatus Lachnoclostridium stercoripullorum]
MRSGVEMETERVLLENYDKYYRLAYSYMKSEQDALDVVQESAYKAIRDCGQVKEQRYIGTWLYRIVVNTALDALRRRGREVALEEWQENSWQPSYAGLELWEILDRLDEKERTVVVLRYFHDLKLEDIAGILGENVNTVKARLYRTLKKMRMELEPEAVGRR